MSTSLVRRLSAFASAALIGTLGVSGAALAHPGPAPSAPTPTAPSPSAPGPDRAAQRIPVVITLKNQPRTPSEAIEKRNLSAQDALVARWNDEFGFELDRRFGYLFNGMSGTVPLSRLGALSLAPEVESVKRERVYDRLEHSARDLHGVPAAFRATGADGTGMVISIIDSGIDPTHRDMRLDDCGAAKIKTINKAPDGHFTCKVPTGYNYADESFVVKDASKSPHGMHVAGIAAANGSEGDTPGDVSTTGRIDGIAPNAQLLAMKVFSNKGGGAADSDILAAIEDSVKLGADVINMSLGSPNGTKSTSNASAVAIAKAREAGIITVVAAGNDGQSFSPDGGPDDALGRLDDGAVSSPAVDGPALSVASLNNSTVTQAAAYIGPDEKKISYEHATGRLDDKTHKVIDIGLGDAAGIKGRTLDGSYALIERGGLPFSEKYENAIKAGAAGVIVFNNAKDGDKPFGMAGVEDFTIPGITIKRSDGLALRALAADGKGTIRITTDVLVSENPQGMEPSSFTSWGTTPTLDFEPEIAGIGGGVYSTLNDDTYGQNQGTSMASPNVAGVSALVLEHLRKTRPEVTGAARVDLAKALLMNTAVVPVNDAGVPYSPRQVGAGLALADKALASRVIATVDGDGAAALREVHGSASFTVTLTSSADKDLVFQVPGKQPVLTESNEAGKPTTTRVSAGTLKASTQRVVVPAGGTAEVTVTVSPESGPDAFVGGWFTLRSEDAAQPDLSVPYLGFAGDWNKEQIILKPGTTLTKDLEVSTQLIASWAGMTVPLNSDLGEFWLSPNGDGDMDTVAVNMAVMRNASDVEYEILTADGKHVATIGQEQDVRRELLGEYIKAKTLGKNPGELAWTGATYDGGSWNAQKTELQRIPDGRYIYRVKARLGEGYAWQHTDLPFGVDATAPVIRFGALERGVLTFTVEEKGSGLRATPTVTTADGKEIDVVDRGDGTFAVKVDPAKVPYLTVSVVDGGFNLAVGTKVFAAQQLVVDKSDALGSQVLSPSSAVVEKGKLVVSGYVSSDITAVRVNGQDPVDASNGRFRDGVALTEGKQTIAVEALDAKGAVVTSQKLTVTYDATAPVVKLGDIDRDPAGAVIPAKDGSVTLRGTVTDERAAAGDITLTVGEGKNATPVKVAADGSFETTVTPPATAHAVVLVASDGGNRASTAVAISGRAAPPAPFAMPKATNAECSFEKGTCFVPGSTKDVNAAGSVFTLKGTVGPGTRSLTLTPGTRLGEDGSYAPSTPIQAKIAKDGTFSIDLPVRTGEVHFRVQVQDSEGRTRLDRGLRLFFDVTAPTLKVSEPTLIGGTLYTRSEEVTFVGEAADDGWGYKLQVNDDVVIDRFDRGSPGKGYNSRAFSHKVTVADGDTLLLTQEDSNGNKLIGGIPVVLDKAAPKAAIDGIAEGEMLRETRKAVVSAEDEHLAGMTVSVDGTVVDEKATELSTAEHAVEDALIDARDLAKRGDAGGAEGTDGSERTAQDATEGASAEAESASPAADEKGATPAGERTAQPVSAAMTAPETTRLESTVSTEDLAPGQHTITVVARDLAGNLTTQSRVFTVDSVLSIAGEDTVGLELHREQLGDQAALAKQVLAGMTAQLDGDAQKAADAGAQLALAPNTVLVEGKQTVTVRATDAAGRVAEKKVTVTVTLKKVTLTDGDVSATSTFRSDDELTAKIVQKDGARVLTVSTKFAALPAQISVPGAEGERVVRIGEGGVQIPVTAQFADGRLTFTGPSHGTYRILAPAQAPDPGDGDNTPGHQGGGSGGSGGSGRGGSEDGGRGSAGSGDSSDGHSGGSMARTGTEVLGLAAAAAALLAGGGLLIRRRLRG